MRNVRKRTKLRVRLMRMVTRIEHLPLVEATTFAPTRVHLPRTSHERRPATLVDTSESSGVDDPAVSVAAVHVSRSVEAAATGLPVGRIEAQSITSMQVAMRRPAVKRRGTFDMTSIRIRQATHANLRDDSYVALMNNHLSAASAEAHTMRGIVVIAMTRDHAEVWSLDERQRAPLAVLVRHDEHGDHRHVRTGQFAHGHASEEGFGGFYADIATVIEGASEIMIAGHGKGRANAMESFAEFLKERRPDTYAKVSELRYVDLPHTTGRELAALARGWKKQQSVVGRGSADIQAE